jgi:thiol-disulfide isomerase/thioredoxin
MNPPRCLARLSVLIRLGFLCILAVSTCRADLNVATPSGDTLQVKEWGNSNRGPLFIWLLNQYAETERQEAIATELAKAGASVWRVDLLEDLMQPRSAEAIRNLDGAPVAALIDEALRTGRRPVVLVACDRMAVPLLRGLRAWQEQGGDNRTLAGAVLFFPNLYLGTPVAGDAPRLSGIVAATNLPLVIVQPELGVNSARLPDLLATLHQAGSPAFSWIVPGVRDYYLMQVEKPRSESLQELGGPVPAEVARAGRETPALLMRAARLLAGTPRPSGPAPIRVAKEQASAPAYGLIERPRQAAPDYVLKDARGRAHAMADNRGRVTLVNFWATWCPPCVHEIPSMNRLVAAYDPRDFAIVSVNFKESPAHVQAFMNKIAVDFPVLIDPDGATAARWRVFAFPSSFLVDRQGRIRYSVNTAIEWDTPEVRAVIDRLRAEPGTSGSGRD